MADVKVTPPAAPAKPKADPKASLKNFVFSKIEDAKIAAGKQSEDNPRKRIVFVAEVAGKTAYIVAQSLGRARSHAVRYFDIKVELAEPGQRGFTRKPIDEQLADAAKNETPLSPEQIANMQAILAKMAKKVK